MRKYILLALYTFSFSTLVSSFEKEITINVDPGKQDCFYQNISEGQVMEIEYQVIDGRHGDLDISFQLIEPTGRVIQAEYKKSENNHRVEAKVSGDYKFCFDNTYSSYNSKTVYFELIVENADEENDEWNNNDIDFAKLDEVSPEEVYDMKIQDIQESILKVRGQLNKVRQLQEMFKSFEARDRNVAEENFFKVNSFSLFQIVIMLVVGFIQVVMLKSLFDNSSKVHKIWKNFNGR